MAEATENLVVIAGSDLADDVSVVDIVDNVLTTGVVIRGSLVISLAGVDLIYLGMDVILSSVETAMRYLHGQQPAASKSQQRLEGTPR